MRAVFSVRRVLASLTLLVVALKIVASAQASGPAMTVPGALNVSSSGAAVYSIPIVAPPGTAGMVPQLSLDYSSQNSDGIVGWQWALDGLSAITRCPRTVGQDAIHGSVNYDTNDRFCLDGQRLILIGGTYGADGSEYRTEIESFTRVLAHGTAGSGPSWFEVHTKSGLVLQYGNTTDSRILAVGKTTARLWTVNKVSDVKGNYYTVTYTNDTTNGQYYPTRIDFTGNTGASVSPYNSVQFSYNTSRADVTPAYQAGSLIQTTVLLTDIKTYQGANLVYDYKLAYRAGTTTVRSRLTSVTLCDNAGTTCLAPTTFGWQGGTGQNTMTGTANGLAQGVALTPGDFSGDGLTDAFVGSNCKVTETVYTGSASGTFSSSSITLAGHPIATSCTLSQMQAIDVQPDGIADLFNYRADVTQGQASNGYEAAVSSGSGALTRTSFVNSVSSIWGYPGDFNGDGRPDLVAEIGPNWTYYIGNGNGTWSYGSPTSGIQPGAVADFDGDGCTDIVNYYSTATIQYSCNPATASVALPSTAGMPIFLDANGDGKTDILFILASSAQLWLSTGTGFVQQTSCTLPTDWSKYAIYTADINGDGKVDLLLVAPGGSGMYGVGTSHKLYVSTGKCFTPALDTGNNPITISNTNALDTSVAAVVADWNNDGAADFWLKKPSGDTLYNFAYVPELMTSISNGVGATTTIAYDRLNKNGTFYTKGSGGTYPVVQVDGPAYVVSSVTTSNGIGGTVATTYAYSGAYGNLNAYTYTSSSGGQATALAGLQAFGPGHMVLGFTKVTATDQRTGVLTTTNYRTDFPYVGRIASQTRTSGSVTLSTVTNTWASTTLSGLGSTSYYFVSLTQSVASGNDLNAAALPTITTAYTYDSYGSPLTITVSRSDSTTSTTTNTFTNDTTNWLLGQLATSQIENVVGTSDLTRHLSVGHDTGTGLINQEIIEPSNPTYKLEADFTLDAFGHATTTALSGTGITTRSSSVGFDTLGEFATSTTNALSQSDGTTFNALFGTVSSRADLNGLSTSYSYDTLGRVILQTLPVGTKTKFSYSFCSGVNGGSATCPTYGAYLAQSEQFASDGVTQIGPIRTLYFDALGRTIASDTQGFDGSNIRAATQYDAYLRVSQTSRSYFTTGGTAKWTAYTYDALDRVTKATFPDTSATTFGYNGLTTSVTNNLSQTTYKTYNAEGLVASVKDALSHTTTYAYDAFGDLTSTTDPSGNVVSSTYDIRGRKTGSTDPDMGSWTYSYDVLSELLTQIDAKSQTTTIGYDLLGRATSRTETDLYSSWTYGTSVTNHNVGAITEAEACTTSACGTVVVDKTFTYDSLARPSTSTIAVGGTNYGYSETYDTYGRLATTTFPSGFVQNNVYNNLSYPCRLTDNTGSPTCASAGGANLFWTANTLDAELHLLQQTAGNSVVTTDTFDANTGRITNVRAGPSNNVAQFDYTWDTIGNLTKRADDYQGTFEYFCYDALNRLTNSAIGTGATLCTSSGSGITTKTVGYDQLGDISSKSDVGTYSYPASGSSSVRPHAVSSIAGTVNGTTNPIYAYDANGNLTCEYTGASCTGANIVRSVAVTASNMAATITQGTTTISFAYDSEHQRITQGATVSGTTTTATYLTDPLTGASSEVIVSGSTTTWHDYISAGGQIVAERFCTGASPCSTGATFRYFVVDHLGSTAALTDGSGTVTERLSYDGWGKRRNANGTDDTTCALTSGATRGFTGQEHIDALCAINLNARIYDPVIGRFISADSVVPGPFDGQAFNRYSYVENGPLSATDPTGHVGDLPPILNFSTLGDQTNGIEVVPVDGLRWGDPATAPVTANDLAPGSLTPHLEPDPSPSRSPQPAHFCAPNESKATGCIDPPTPTPIPTPVIPPPIPIPTPKPIDPNGATPQPKLTPCTAWTRTKGAGALVWNSLDATVTFGMGTTLTAFGSLAIGVGCVDPTPFEPATCFLGGVGAVSIWAAALPAYATSGAIVKYEVIPDLGQLICTKP